MRTHQTNELVKKGSEVGVGVGVGVGVNPRAPQALLFILLFTLFCDMMSFHHIPVHHMLIRHSRFAL